MFKTLCFIRCDQEIRTTNLRTTRTVLEFFDDTLYIGCMTLHDRINVLTIKSDLVQSMLVFLITEKDYGEVCFLKGFKFILQKLKVFLREEMKRDTLQIKAANQRQCEVKEQLVIQHTKKIHKQLSQHTHTHMINIRINNTPGHTDTQVTASARP